MKTELSIGCAIFCLALATGAQGAAPTTLYTFQGGSDGATPQAAMIDVGGVLYGTTSAGGSGGGGVIFTFDPASGTERVAYAFLGGADGFSPAASLLNVGGILWGTTQNGGPHGTGTIFQFNPATGVEAVKYAFAAVGGADGALPEAALISVGGIFYGTTYGGGPFGPGADGYGTVFSFDPASGIEAPLYDFGTNAGDGIRSATPLISIGGLLYGMTYSGTTVFSVNPGTGAEQIFPFPGEVGPPGGGLISVGSSLYGTVNQGLNVCPGAGCGEVFSFNPGTSAIQTVYAFMGGKTDGSGPGTGLVQSGSLLIGATDAGGSTGCYKKSGCGTVYSINVTTDAEKLIAKSTKTTGLATGALVKVGKLLYGVTQNGGINGSGTIFSVKP